MPGLYDAISVLFIDLPYAATYHVSTLERLMISRPEAFRSAHQGVAAAAEFRKILDHRGLLWNCATGALAHLGLARAYVLAGDTVKARAAYQDFLAFWKAADADIPVLRAAKSEAAKLE
ncbi:MAG TPA: hypothetical protein VJX29_13935 [Candidatus Acidoferrales bacterium]|nr:hypothetical protein [Candidatus Acidoferrales bacterium]